MVALAPLTYAKAGVTPDNWADLTVIDNETGREVRFVEEVNTLEGWVRRHVVGLDGRFVHDGESVASEVIHGDFSIVTGVSARRVWQGNRMKGCGYGRRC
ncbi:hypothetical protein [Thalassospira xiamenensis]|uniref:hypothetical protein n=1 Tax=Thalassospira xiamenensis TaxID=220697 RepID=UPI000DEDA1E2|nr:hypothetical protein [Thalassospira xiamenensis]RCK40468.1 hypothetical protein TH24_11055 [Thalassospira xiamenensis]